MYHFAIVALLGLVVLAVTDVLKELVPTRGAVNALANVVLGVAVALILDYSVFGGFGITVREPWMGTLGTGLMIGSLATLWRALFGYLTPGEDRTATDRQRRRPQVAA